MSSSTDNSRLIDEAIDDAKKSKIIGVILSNIGIDSFPCLKDPEWRNLRKKIEEIKSDGGASDAEKALGIYMTAEEWINWYDRFFQAIIGVATLGAGFTFSVIVSSLESPDSSLTGKLKQNAINEVRFWLSLSWLLFVLSLAWASLASQIIIANKRWFMESFNLSTWTNKISCARNWRRFLCSTMTLVGQLLPLAALGTSAEAVRRYEPQIGKAGEVLIGVIAVVLVLLWLGQNVSIFRRMLCLDGRKKVMREEKRAQKDGQGKVVSEAQPHVHNQQERIIHEDLEGGQAHGNQGGVEAAGGTQ